MVTPMTNTTAAKLTIEVIRDCEGEGRCGACDREGLRWVAQLSDGSNVGLECAKRVLGFKPAPKSYNWQADYTLKGTLSKGAEFFGVWIHTNGRAAAITRNGVMVCNGPAEWVAEQLKRYAA